MNTDEVQGKTFPLKLSDGRTHQIKEPSTLVFARMEIMPYPADSIMSVVYTLQQLLLDTYEDSDPAYAAKCENLRFVGRLVDLKGEGLEDTGQQVEDILIAGVPKNLLAEVRTTKKAGPKATSAK